MGGLARFGLETGMFKGVLEAGSASGDDNPFDDQVRGFSFDREYRVGLLLFREVLRTATAVTAYNVADPAYRGAPPRGFDRIATGGAVRGATYVNPRFTLKPTDGLHVFAGFLYAASDGEYVDAFRSGLEGGAPVGPRGARAADDLGWEVDLGVRYAFDVERVRLAVRAEGAWFVPGEVFDDEDGAALNDIFGFWLNLGARW